LDTSGIAIGPLDTSLNPLDISLDTSNISFDTSDIANDTSGFAIDMSSISLDPLDISLDALDTSDISLDPLDISLNPLDIAIYISSISLDPLDTSLDALDTSLDPLDTSLDASDTSLDASDISLDPLDISLDPLDISLDPLDISLNPLDIAFDTSGSAIDTSSLALQIPIQDPTDELIKEVERTIRSGQPASKDTYEKCIDFLDRILAIFDALPNIFIIDSEDSRFKIIGDTHGTTDLLPIIKEYEDSSPSDKNQVIFMGDFVDRGNHQLENLILVLWLKVKFPNFVHILRGNHEDEIICSSYGLKSFKAECQRKITRSLFHIYWDQLMNFFAFMPLACIANGNFYVHGGLPMTTSGRILDINTVNGIDRKKKTIPEPDTDENQCLGQMLWGDPALQFGTSSRGGGTSVFGPENTKNFFEVYKDFNIKCVIRAHEVQTNGFGINHQDESQNPICITIFSASRYCSMQNKGAVAIIEKDGAINAITYTCGDEIQNKTEEDMEAVTPRNH
jgi:hypothetical protein